MSFSEKSALGLMALMASGFFTPAAAQNVALQIQICNDDALENPERIEACSLVLDSGRVPDLSPFLMWRGSLYFIEGMPDEAKADFDAVVALFPDESGPHFSIALNFIGLGDYALALEHYDEAIRLDPEVDTYYNNKAWLLATAPDETVRDGATAVASAMRAVELKNIGNNRDTLAAAYAEAGDFEHAVEEQEAAIEMFEDEDYDDYIPGAEERLALYRQNMPFHENRDVEPRTAEEEDDSE
jgi:tetratricopeptide (TPR) repeat protein